MENLGAAGKRAKGSAFQTVSALYRVISYLHCQSANSLIILIIIILIQYLKLNNDFYTLIFTLSF